MLNKKFIIATFAFIVASYLSGCTSTEDGVPPQVWSKYKLVIAKEYKPAKYPKDVLRCHYTFRKETLEEIEQFFQAQLQKNRWSRFKAREDEAYEDLSQKLPYTISFHDNGEENPIVRFGDGVILVSTNEYLGGQRFIRISPEEERQLLSITGMDGSRSYTNCSN
ncbi:MULTISPECIES: hypothetical protein [Pseudanabaena]|uniref:Uncharacterized protein n=2 Tax=Pseudanabaena TaxID=1152 RepID=L8MUV6_9CYAN|nr:MULTISPECIES: hypothetical protein [Pseudanabaena]ELS30240.1 hypothetical protein Pse7429DRAFT_4644 [Pseudanabaena biceps PCC 7429]MDG3497471.1 hypothetical protein [Pseudanabaena catenata USMAC16]